MTNPKIIIESDVPYKPRRKLDTLTAQIGKMKVGQSFRVPAGLNQSNIYTLARRSGFRMSTRKVQEGAWLGLRTWRVK